MDFIRPKRMPEANIQAEIYRYCRNNNISICLEYKKDNCRFDAVIIKNEKIIAIVETKSRKNIDHDRVKRTLQYRKYKKYNVPIILCLHWSEIEKTCQTIANMYNNIY